VPTELEQQLLEQSTFIAVLYGAIFVIGFTLLVTFALRLQANPLDWSDPLRRLRERPWTWHEVLRIILPLLLAQAVFGLLYRRLGPDDPGDADRFMLVAQGFLFHGLCFLLVAFLIRWRSLSWPGAFGVVRGNLLAHAGWGVLALLGTMPIIIAYNMIAQILMYWWGLEPQLQDVTRIISSADTLPLKIYFVLLATVAAPVVEEIFFRGVLLPAAARIIGVRAALVLVATLFSLVHGFYMPASGIFFILSLAFSLAYIYRGSLVTPIVMHAAFNSLTVIVLMRM
jgi:membrane protease YdiL (CAAX protease family)